MIWSIMPSSSFARDLNKVASQWHGFNLLNYFNGEWTEPFREEEFEWMHEWGFNFVRVPISYWAWSKPGDYYHMDEKVLQDIDRCVAWGQKHKIHVCINLHRAPGYCVNPPAEPEDLFKEQSALDGCAYQWTVLAKRYKNVSSKWLSFNLLNEVGDIPAENYERVVRRLVTDIRKVSPKRLIMIDGIKWGEQPLMNVNDIDNLMQCGRGYQPMYISHYNATWVKWLFDEQGRMRLPRERLTWPLHADGTTYDKEWIRHHLNETWQPMLDRGHHALFIGEFGSHNETPHSVAMAWLRDQLEIFREMKLGWTLWNLRGSFGILDSGRKDVEYEDFHGHKLDRKMLELLQEYTTIDKAQSKVRKPYKKDFLYRQGTQLMLNGKPYQCASFNSFQLTGCGNNYELFTPKEMDSLFASLPRNVIVRTWAFPGNDTQTDAIISCAKRHHIKLILSLGDGRSSCGHHDGARNGDGSGKTEAWYRGGYKTEYLPHVIKTVTRYKDEPTIAMWEIINEPGDVDVELIREFLHSIAAIIKQHDPNHLTESGTFPTWAYGEEGFKKLHDCPHIDVGNIHEYDYDYQDSHMIESPHFKNCRDILASFNKPIIVGETGIEVGGNKTTTRERRVEDMQKKFDVYLQNGAAVVLVWNLAHRPGGGNQLTFGMDDPLLDMIRNYKGNKLK